MNQENKNTKIGYALGGGAARGLFHIGVLNVLEEYGIYPDVIAGTSMGSIIGALYASGMKADELKQIACSIDWKQVVRLTDLTFPVTGLIQGRRIVQLLKSILGDTDFNKLKYKFAAVAVDLYTGQQVVYTKGSLIEGIRASIAVPGIFTPVNSNGRYLVDGGLVNVVPVSVCRDLGANYVIGVNAIPDPISGVMPVKIGGDNGQNKVDTLASNDLDKPIIPDAKVKFDHERVNKIDEGIRRFLLYRQPKLQKIIARKPATIFSLKPKQYSIDEPDLFEILSQSLSIIEYHIAMENLQDADIAISPIDKTIGFWEFHRAKEAIEAGEKAIRLLLHRDTVARMQLEILSRERHKI